MVHLEYWYCEAMDFCIPINYYIVMRLRFCRRKGISCFCLWTVEYLSLKLACSWNCDGKDVVTWCSKYALYAVYGSVPVNMFCNHNSQHAMDELVSGCVQKKNVAGSFQEWSILRVDFGFIAFRMIGFLLCPKDQNKTHQTETNRFLLGSPKKRVHPQRKRGNFL